MTKTHIIFAAIAFAIVGCASTSTSVLQIGDNTYMSSDQSSFERSGSVLKARLYKEAIEFCKSKGKNFEQISSTSKDTYPFSPASAEIQFACK